MTLIAVMTKKPTNKQKKPTQKPTNQKTPKQNQEKDSTVSTLELKRTGLSEL